jgi:tetratricopeptide (TPR) repeat protein
MKKATLMAGVVALAAGMLIGRYALPSSTAATPGLGTAAAVEGCNHDPSQPGPEHAAAAPMAGAHGMSDAHGMMGGMAPVDPAGIAELEKQVQANPRNADLLVELARLQRRAGEAEKAKARLAEALKINPEHPIAHYELGVLGLHGETPESEAIAHFERYLKADPNGANAEMARRSLEHLRSLSN